MFALLLCILTLHQAHSACVVQDICTENAAVQADIVDLHNAFRRAVQPTASDMLKMNYSVEVAASAQAWVDKCILAHGDPASRTLNGYELGENLFYSSTPLPWKDVITAWHNEVSRFQYPDISTNGLPIGHYTQVIWNSSYRVGCGMTLCNNSTYFYGCHYYRAGNFKGWKPYSLGAPCASCPNSCDDKLCTDPCPVINHFLNCPTLVDLFGCEYQLVSSWCPATCTCPTEIIPIA